MTVEPTRPRRLITETGGAALSFLMGLCVLGPLGPAAAGFVSVTAQPLLERFVARCVDEFGRRGDVLAEAASRSSGLDQKEVVERLLESVEHQPLIARVVDAAARTSSTETLRLLGLVLGEAVGDRPRTIDEDLMLIDGIQDLEAGHLRLLEVLEQPADPFNPAVFWGMEQIATVVGDSLSPVGLQAAIGGLLGRGLIQPMSGLGGGGYAITDFGRAALGALRRSKPN